MALAIIITAKIIPEVSLAGGWAAFLLAAVLAVINAVIRPLLILITLPINILTLGLFTFVINALMILLAGVLVSGFDPGGFWRAMLFSILLSVASYLLSSFLLSRK